AVTNGSGVEFVGDAHGFDAFGRPRGRDWQSSGDKLHPDTDYGKTTEHGFTGHEHLDDTYLIHMNGRMYDYRLGRFLSVDPIISSPANSQSINPYSYIGNNPLSGVDPTGYEDVSACQDQSTCGDGTKNANADLAAAAAQLLGLTATAQRPSQTQTASGVQAQGASNPLSAA